MIKEILKGFKCDEALQTEVEKLVRMPSGAAGHAMAVGLAVGLVGTCWSPIRIEDAIRAALGTSPIEAARAWARSIDEETLSEVEAEHATLANGLAEDIVHLLSADEESWTEAERKHVREAERKLYALSFILDAATNNPLDETTFLAETG